jgi:hypothetical protein
MGGLVLPVLCGRVATVEVVVAERGHQHRETRPLDWL